MSKHRKSKMSSKWLSTSIAFSFLLAGCSRKIQVSIINDSGHRIENVNISAQGQEFSLGTMAPGDQKRAEFKPRTDSAVEINFVPPATHDPVSRQLAYFESGYRGRVHVRVEENFEVRVTNDLSLGL